MHKAFLSLSRCADMGLESRFGRLAGALIDEVTQEVIPLHRKGNLHVLKSGLRLLLLSGRRIGDDDAAPLIGQQTNRKFIEIR